MTILTEQRTDPDGTTYLEHWETEPPAPGIKYRVTNQTWENNYTTRHIHAWEPA